MQTVLAGLADEARLREALRKIIERNLAFCLVCSDGISERIFYFAIGGVRVIASGPRQTPTVGEDLVQRGAITTEQYNKAIAAVNGDPRRIAEAVAQLGFAQAAVVQEAILAQVETELLDLFFWDGLEISLAEGQPPKSFYEGRFQTAAVTCSVSGLLQGVLERVDVWKQTVPRLPAGRDVYETTEKAAADSGGRHGRLLQLLDGTRTAAEAIEKSRTRRVAGFEYLMMALSQGKVRRTVGTAAQRASRDQLMRDIELLEQALRQRVDATIVRYRLARTLEAVGEAARSASQWRDLGDHYRKLNELDRALECYGEAVRVLPTDFSTRELILEIYRHRKQMDLVVAHGRPLADLFLKHNLLNRAKQLLLQLVGLEPDDVSLRRQLLVVLIGLGERELALKHLRELAAILEGRKASAGELRDVYVRILALDPRDRNARRRLDEISGVASQRRAIRVTAAATAVVVLGLGTVFWLESAARRDVADAISAARLALAAKDAQKAMDELRAVEKRHPLAASTRNARNLLAQIERLERERMERAARRARITGESSPTEIAERARRAKETTTGMAREASRLVAEGRIADAHRVHKELFTMYGGTQAAVALRVPLSIVTTPRDARILLNGEVAGHGSAIVEYSPARPGVLEVELDGYAPRRIPLDGLQAPEIQVALHRPVRWTASFDAAVDASPAASGGIVYVAGRDRFLSAISASDGTTLWRTPLGMYSDASAAPVVCGGEVVVGTATGEAVGVDAATGAIAWRRAVGRAVDAAPVVAGDAVVVASADGAMAALSPRDGAPVWSLPPRTSGAGGPFVVAETGEVGIVEPRGTLAWFSADAGHAAQRPPVPAVLRGTPASGAGDRVWVFAEDETLRLVAASTGTALRRFPVPKAYLDARPETAGDTAWVVSQDGTVAAFRADGETVFRRRLDQPAPAGVCHANGRIYVGAGPTLRVLDAATGADVWSFDAGSRISARPVVAGGTVYVATAAGRVFVLAE